VAQVHRIEGRVVTVDRFGNLITNIAAGLLDRAAFAGAVVEVGGARAPLRETYSDVEPGALVALVNAFDVLEVAERDGDAATSLGIGRETTVLVRARPRDRA
jgi:S-adenosylmethionine hydrolase